jgi:hypothetical protein
MRSQPRSLLSTAKLNLAKSRVRCAAFKVMRIAQTSFSLSGGFWPMILPLFQGAREIS